MHQHGGQMNDASRVVDGRRLHGGSSSGINHGLAPPFRLPMAPIIA
jgi:hypothetical protein